MIRCIIVDDEINNSDALKKMLDLYLPSVELVGIASNITEAKEIIEAKDPNLVFLDVEMPGGNGFELLESFQKINFNVVFTTAHAAYAIKAIKFAAMDYLLKPINLQELKVAVEKCNNFDVDHDKIKQQVEVLKNNRLNDGFRFAKIALSSSLGLEFYETKDIVRCEADRAYCKFHMLDGKSILVSKPMSEYEDILTQSNFIKVHKSNIVNLSHVMKYIKGAGGYLIMRDNSRVNVAVRRKDELLKVIEARIYT